MVNAFSLGVYRLFVGCLPITYCAKKQQVLMVNAFALRIYQ